MTTFELTEYIDDLLLSIDSQRHLMNSLVLMNEQLDGAKGVFDIFDSVSSDTNQKIANKKKEFQNSIRILKDIKPRNIFIETNILYEKLKQFSNLTISLTDPEVTTDLLSLISEFIEKYEEFIIDYKHSIYLEVLFLARELQSSLMILKDSLLKIKNNLSVKIDYTDEDKLLSIYIPSEIEYSLFVKKLVAIENLYYESAELFSISIVDHPIKLSKIESGSLWVEIFGESKLIKFILKLIDRGIRYIHRNFTKEGKLESIPRNAEQIKSVLEIAKELEKNGIDTSAMKDNISKAGVIISENLTSLLERQSVIKVNKKVYSVSEESIKKLPPYEKKLLSPPESEADE